MLKGLIQAYGKDKLNTLTKYPSIQTLHKLGDKGILTDELNIQVLPGEPMTATEKIDGTNVRIIFGPGEFILGSREFLLYHSNDLFYDPSQGIVDGIRKLIPDLLSISTRFHSLRVVYGEFYGGKTSSHSKNYGTDQIGFRIFDSAVFGDMDNLPKILNQPLEKISRWREHETDHGIQYGQNFMYRDEMEDFFRPYNFKYVPEVEFGVGDCQHQTILDNLKKFIPTTNVALSPTALKKPEGIVLRNHDRSKIIKVRYEDYERTLKNKGGKNGRS